MNGTSSDAGLPADQNTCTHRTSTNYQKIVVRTLAVGGVAACIGFLAEMTAPDADALSILLPAGNGNATQINILEGNIFNPQFGAGGNVSNNTTIANVFFGQGNHSSQGTSGGGLFGPLALGGASGNGNVTQINILSFNIFNPQLSVNGGNYSNNTTVSNVAVGNGNYSDNSGSSGGTTMFGGSFGNGNTRQVSLFSGNIFNPQFSLFGDNYSNNTAIANVSLFNGNFSNNSGTGDGFAGFLGSLTGNGNTNQLAAGVTNIINPQFTFGGKNTSNNDATTNLSGGNGNHSNNEVGSAGTGAGRRREWQRQHRPDCLGRRQQHQRAASPGYLAPRDGSSRTRAGCRQHGGCRRRGHEYHEYLAPRDACSRAPGGARRPGECHRRGHECQCRRCRGLEHGWYYRSSSSAQKCRQPRQGRGRTRRRTVSTKRSGSTSPHRAGAKPRVSLTAATRPAGTTRNPVGDAEHDGPGVVTMR